ncbi:hypothetical protein ABZ636_01435 [Streptomyces sp. NPDC007251]|uniref:hypothetical protein n=1 Tax=Streptomyces sp. NPDC007251 TaxID=3154483 RepID=UPI0033D60AC0
MPHLTPQAADALRADLVCGTRRDDSGKLPFCGIGPGNTYVLLSQLRAELPGRRSRGHKESGPGMVRHHDRSRPAVLTRISPE